MSDNQFGKQEKLKSRKAINYLFEKGNSVFFYPVRIIFSSQSDSRGSQYPLKCGVSVPKSKFKKAVDRNLLKRRMREAYRLNKKVLAEKLKANETSANLFIIYVSKEKEDFFKIQQGIVKGLSLIMEEISGKEKLA